MSGFWIITKTRDQAEIKSTEAGSTLLEVMVAMVLTLLLIESLVQLMLVGVNGIGLAGQRTIACTYADSLLEEMKARPELLSGVSANTSVRASDLPFWVPIPADVEVYISWSSVDGVSTLRQVKLKVLSTRGNKQWEENLIGLIPAPLNQDGVFLHH